MSTRLARPYYAALYGGAPFDGPTGLVRLPDGRWVIAETGHHGLRVLSRP